MVLKTLYPAAERFRTTQPGITTWHSFSSGAHYDPANLSYGRVLACDEHLLDPGAGFETHPHARVELVSWVLEGALQHEDSAGRTTIVTAGQAQYQLAGEGIEHSERNASSTEPLHFVQFWLLSDEDVPDYNVAAPPMRLSVGSFTVLGRCRGTVVPAGPKLHLLVTAGRYRIAGYEIGPGDSLRLGYASLEIEGDGELLVLATVDT